MDYGTEVRRRFANLASAGVIYAKTGRVVEGSAEDPSLGFWVRFQVSLQGAAIETVRFQAFGCPQGLAAADLIAGELPGKPIAALLEVDSREVARRLEMPRSKLGKLLRIEDALAACHAKAVSRERG